MSDEEFWKMSMRRLHGLITLDNQKHTKAEESKKKQQLNNALNAMRGL